jgi:hypothetical protein
VGRSCSSLRPHSTVVRLRVRAAQFALAQPLTAKKSLISPKSRLEQNRNNTSDRRPDIRCYLLLLLYRNIPGISHLRYGCPGGSPRRVFSLRRLRGEMWCARHILGKRTQLMFAQQMFGAGEARCNTRPRIANHCNLQCGTPGSGLDRALNRAFLQKGAKPSAQLRKRNEPRLPVAESAMPIL